jgi:hypothetical protein
MFAFTKLLETAIPKKSPDGKPKKPRREFGGPAPPPLSEELIAQLQGAVRAAQRKKVPLQGSPPDQDSNHFGD